MTYNSFTDARRVIDAGHLTMYCGSRQNYYVFYQNDNGKVCSNTFDTINCIGLLALNIGAR